MERWQRTITAKIAELMKSVYRMTGRRSFGSLNQKMDGVSLLIRPSLVTCLTTVTSFVEMIRTETTKTRARIINAHSRRFRGDQKAKTAISVTHPRMGVLTTSQISSSKARAKYLMKSKLADRRCSNINAARMIRNSFCVTGDMNCLKKLITHSVCH